MDSTVSAWLDYLRVSRGASPHTLRNYGADLHSLSGFLAARGSSLAKATRRELRAWLANLGNVDKRPAPASLARRVAAIHSFYRWYCLSKGLSPNPSEGIRGPKVPRRVPGLLEVPEAAAVVENPPQEGILALRNRALLELLYGAGLRVSEVVALDMGDVNLAEQLVRVRHGKGDKARVVPFGPPAAVALDALFRTAGWASASRHDPVFRNHKGGRLSDRSARRIVDAAGNESGVSHMHPHRLRHACATHMLAGGADIRAIQEQLGHESLATTERYTHVDPAHLLRVYRGAHPRARAIQSRREESE